MQMFAFKNTEAGIRALHRQIATFETTTQIADLYRDKWKFTVQQTPFKRIETRACKVFRVSIMELRSARRNKRVALARQFIYYWATRLTIMSMSQIGRLLGGRDPTTCLHGKHAYIKKRAQMGRTLREVR